MTIKFFCQGEAPDKSPMRWGGLAESINVRDDGALVIRSALGGRMGFRRGTWARRTRTGDYDIYDVDFSQRFAPRRMQ